MKTSKMVMIILNIQIIKMFVLFFNDRNHHLLLNLVEVDIKKLIIFFSFIQFFLKGMISIPLIFIALAILPVFMLLLIT